MAGNVTERPVDRNVTKQRGRHRRRVPLRQEHKEKLTNRKPIWSTMVTQTLPRRDPRSRTEAAIRAVKEELKALREEGTWDEWEVYELDDARKLYPDGHFSRIFAIVGIKNIEGSDADFVFKGRIVLGGDNIKDDRRKWAIFEELGSVPTSMSACRILQACAA